MFPFTPTQLTALQGSHQMDLKVSVLRGSTLIAANIEIESGHVDATYSTQGGRDAGIVVSQNVIDQGLLNPMSDQVYIRTGIPGFLEVPIFTGRVDAHNRDGSGLVDVPLISRGEEAIRAGLETPWAAIDGSQARDEIKRILQNVDVNWAVDISRAQQTIIPRGLVWEDDRGQALDQLARGASLIWQPDRTGGFTVYTNPYLIGTVPSVSIMFRDGTGGTTVEVTDAISRDGIYNSVTVVAEKYGNQAPIRVTVRDNGVNSPTRWGGLFGKQNLIIKSQIPIDVNGARELAIRILNQSLALQRSWTITTPHMPLLDPGDVFGLWYDNEVTTQVAESIEYTINAQDPTVITSRELRTIAVEILTS
jgi:hypothetical protein